MSDKLHSHLPPPTAGDAIQELLFNLIAQTGPLPISQFIEIVLGHPEHGYYRRQNPIGATGAAQIVEVVRQLRGQAGDRQVEGAKVGLTHCTGGGISGFDHGACSIHIFSV